MDEMGDREFLAMSARMEGKSTIAANTGRKVRVSEMELIALCNMSQIGLLYLFSQLDGEAFDGVTEKLNEFLDEIRREFGKNSGGPDGLTKLMVCAAAVIRAGRLEKYLIG